MGSYRRCPVPPLQFPAVSNAEPDDPFPWIGTIYFAPETRLKLAERNRPTPAQVEDAVARGAHDGLRWHTHEVYGRRLVATGRDDQGRMIVYLRPANDLDDGTWECMTAWRLDG